MVVIVGGSPCLKIDVHCHILPGHIPETPGFPWKLATLDDDVFGAKLECDDGTVLHKLPLSCFDIDVILQESDAVGIDVLVMSTMIDMLCYYLEPRVGIGWARYLNDDIAATCKARADRLVGLGTVPLQDPEAAVLELRRCVLELGLRGVQIGSHMDAWDGLDEKTGKPMYKHVALDAAVFKPFWSEAERLGAAIMVHPGDSEWGCSDFPSKRGFVRMPSETAVTGTALILCRILDEFPSLKVLLSHGSKSLHLISRIQWTSASDCGRQPVEIAKRLFFDSTHNSDILRLLVETAGAERVVFGRNGPFTCAQIPSFTLGSVELLDDFPGMTVQNMHSLLDEEKRALLAYSALTWLGLEENSFEPQWKKATGLLNGLNVAGKPVQWSICSSASTGPATPTLTPATIVPAPALAAPELQAKLHTEKEKREQLINMFAPFAIWFVCVAIVWLATLRITGNFRSSVALACVTFVVLGWVLRPAGCTVEYTSFAFLLVVVLSGTLTWQQALKSMSAGGLWLIFFGMCMTVSLSEMKVVDRIAAQLCKGTYSWNMLLLRLHILAFILSIVMPSQMVRVQFVVVIARKVVEHMKINPYSRHASAVVLSLVITTNNSGLGILTGALPNIIGAGILQTCEIEIKWGFWFLGMFPTFGIGSAVVSFLILWLATRKEPWTACKVEREAELTASGPGSSKWKEHVVAAVFCMCLALWGTDMLHGIDPVLIAMGAVTILFSPCFLSFRLINQQANFLMVFFIAAAITTPATIEQAPEFHQLVGRVARETLLTTSDSSLQYALCMILGWPIMLICNAALPMGMLVPFFCPGSDLSDLGLDSRLGAMAIAAVTNSPLLPYQQAPFLIALVLSSDIVRHDHFIVCQIANAVANGLLLAPLTFGYWRLIALDALT
eukprot:TRINITY_DN14690_c0_g1_i1.p1 TRINITY_DN14690_c0_g1~~TRINITY_DN14690_c0_g1_i1.p1  ORF type:complete len:898 (+),score=130.77 TRINITY_DN14690_c0_g1_i1:75-2768(+)